MKQTFGENALSKYPTDRSHSDFRKQAKWKNHSFYCNLMLNSRKSRPIFTVKQFQQNLFLTPREYIVLL
jgi:hypothetical protein